MQPLTFEPILVPKPWGGRRLAEYGKPLPPEGTFGESWDIADLPAAAVTSADRTRTPVAGGPDAGLVLRELIARDGADLLGSARPTDAGDFPLLVKLLDAREHLSVQVHPTAEYVSSHPGTRLKTESWYVVDADPGAVIYKGFRRGVTMDDLHRAAGTRAFVELLQPVEAVPGDFHHLPAGIVHALGAGVMVAEPQTPSDTTFRLYDWTDEYGRAPRPLHLDEALDTIDLDPDEAVFLAPIAAEGSRLLVATDSYWQAEHRLDGGQVPLRTDRELRILMLPRGRARVAWPDGELALDRGATVLLPAALAPEVEVTVVEPATVLETGLV